MAPTDATSPPPAKPKRQIGCLRLLGYGYAVFILLVVGAVWYAHHRKTEVAGWAVERIGIGLIDDFMATYDEETDPLFKEAKDGANADKTLTPNRRANLLAKTRIEVRDKRRKTLVSLRDRLVEAHERGKVGKDQVAELERIFAWLEEVGEEVEKTTYAHFEKLRSDLEKLLATAEATES